MNALVTGPAARRRLASRRLPAAALVVVAITAPGLAADPPPARQPGANERTMPSQATPEDAARKVEIMSGPRWRRAIFELGEWLSSQEIYSPQEVSRIKADFNRRVAGMSSYELEYLLDDLDAKFKVLETPEARDAKAWLGQYLSAMSDQRRAEALRDVPDVVTMTSSQLQQEINRIEQKRMSLQQRQQAFDQSRDVLVQRAADNRQQTAAAAAAAMAQARSSASFSPYRTGGGGGGGAKPPFSDAKGSGMSVGVGPWGAYVSFNTGSF
jgi:FtsZ-binding cell division protein ZapB